MTALEGKENGQHKASKVVVMMKTNKIHACLVWRRFGPETPALGKLYYGGGETRIPERLKDVRYIPAGCLVLVLFLELAESMVSAVAIQRVINVLTGHWTCVCE